MKGNTVFGKKLSTNLAIMELVERISKGIDDKADTLYGYVFRSFSLKTIWHDNNSILLHKLEHIGIRGVVLEWFNNYLSNRKQVVKYKTSISNKMTVKCGVPQDSILGPLLLVIYVNDITNSCQILSFMFLPMILIYSWVIKT